MVPFSFDLASSLTLVSPFVPLVGGNQGITWGGETAASQTGGAPYDDYDGGKAIRFLDPCEDDDTCEWGDFPALYMTTRRWYPTLETLEDGSAIIIGGCEWGGYVRVAKSCFVLSFVSFEEQLTLDARFPSQVNTADENNPTYEFFPSKGAPVTMNILQNSLPANLFALTWLLPSGESPFFSVTFAINFHARLLIFDISFSSSGMLFIQTNWATEIFDYKNGVECSSFLVSSPLVLGRFLLASRVR